MMQQTVERTRAYAEEETAEEARDHNSEEASPAVQTCEY